MRDSLTLRHILKYRNSL